MERPRINFKPFIPYLVIVILVVIGYFVYTNSFITISKFEYTQLTTKAEAQVK